MSMSDKNSKNKPPLWKRKYLVQKAYQLRYSLLIALVGSIALVLAVVVIRYIVSMGLLPIAVPNINLLRITGFMFVSWFLLGIVYTHTTAGPVTQLISQINNVADGKLNIAKVNFRRGDDLQDMPEYFNNMVKVLQYRANEEKILCKELSNHFSQTLESFKDSENINEDLAKALGFGIKKIDKLITKKQRYLGPEDLDTSFGGDK
jgi:methyl-accepting chemotaxis protein